MINTSIAYRRAIEKNREFRVLDRVTFKDGSYIDLQLSDLMSYKINEATSSSGRFDIGAAVIKEYTITLNNMDGRFDLYDFEGADIRARIGLKLENGSWEDLNKGTYRVVDAVFTDVTLQLTAYDAMLFFDRPYSKCTLSYPATVLEIVRSACRDCQVTFDASTVEMGSYRVEKRPGDGSITYRDVIGYCAQIMGSFARIDHLGQLSFGWYNFDSIPSGGLNGGVFDDGSPYVSGDRVDGGTFDSYGAGASYDAGSFSDLDYAHNFYNMRSQSINTADITVTGIQVEVKGEGSQKETYLYGTDTYALEIKDNPLIQAAAIQAVAKHVGDKIINRPFRPLNITIQSDPSIEAGDMALVTDRKQNSYVTCVTETTFALGSAQQVSCSAEMPSEKTYTRYGAGTKLLDKAKDEAETLLSDYDIAVQNMNELAANTMGFYFSAVMQPDGSLVSYRHDKPKLSDSKIVYKKGIDGFFVTQNYTGDDATTRWTSGFDSSGNAVLNILSAIGINFDWAHGGTLTLGGKSNGNGELKILDASGKQIGYINNTGVHFNKGVFEGELKAASGTFKGKLEGATGTFSGELKAARGTFSGDLSADVGGVIGGWKIGEYYIQSKDGSITLYNDGRVKFDDSILSSNGHGMSIKYGLELYTNSGGDFSDGTDGFRIHGLGSLGGRTLVLNSDKYVGLSASSSRRYKDHIRNMSEEEALALLDVPVVWFRYKDGYLSKNDDLNGKEIPGFYAENIADSMKELAIFNPDGSVEDWNYRTVIPVMEKQIQMLNEKIKDITKERNNGDTKP